MTAINTAQPPVPNTVEVDGLLAILPRIDALNSYLRSPARRRGWSGSSLDRVVYHYKREALKDATNWRIAAHRLVAAVTECRDCGGSGKYVDSYGEKWPHCRRCSSSGRVKLRFIESTLDGFIWHTPVDHAYSFMIERTWEMPEHPAVDWHVHQVGRDLDIDTVADHLLAVEAHFPRKTPRYYAYDGCEFDPHNTYTLYAGESDPSTCVLCTGAMIESEGKYPHRLCVSTGRVQWSTTICDACYTAANATSAANVFKAAAARFPESLWTPALRHWAACHPVRERSSS